MQVRPAKPLKPQEPRRMAEWQEETGFTRGQWKGFVLADPSLFNPQVAGLAFVLKSSAKEEDHGQ